MGVYYHYVNFSKRERFAIDALGGGIKFSSIGKTLASRAFSLMMTQECPWPSDLPAESLALLGRWIGDMVAIVGDSDPGFDRVWEFTSLSANAILLVFRIDGFEDLGTETAANDALFVRLCYLVVTRQGLELEEPLKQRFWTDFLNRYEKLRKECWFYQPEDLAKVGS